MSYLSPMESSAFYYSNGLNLSYTSTTSVTLSAGQTRDTTNCCDMNLGGYYGATPVSTLINLATTGVNGLDTGSLAASTSYAIYVIGDCSGRNPTAALASTSFTAPIMQTGYNIFKRVGVIETTSGSVIVNFTQTGIGYVKSYQYATPINVLSAGAATTFTAVSLAATAQLNANNVVYLSFVYTPAVAGNSFSVRPTGSSVSAANSPIVLDGDVIAKAQNYTAIRLLAGVNSGVPSIDYVVTASDTLSINVVAFDDYI